MRILAWFEEILQEKSLCRQTSVLDFLKSSSAAVVSSPVLLDNADDNPDNPPTVPAERPPPLFVILYFCEFFVGMNIHFFESKI